jgi:phage terminase large subunit-like protein
MARKQGCQTPTNAVVLPYKKSYGKKAVDLYNATGRKALKWQVKLIRDILAINNDGLWVHVKVGYSVPRRNGKNEVVAMRELYGIMNGEKILHTAHRTTTSSAASMRLVSLLNDLGWEEVQRVSKKEAYSKHYTYSKQFGLERVTLLDGSGGRCDFRTRSGKGGLGEGFDTLIIDEAQEYTDDQSSALKYVVSDSKNPQIIMLGTPPTAVSSGTVFTKYRNDVLGGKTKNNMWADWGIDEQTDPNNKTAWYIANPSLGTILTERKIEAEIDDDVVDFNIQRLGLWIRYNQKSAISSNEWNSLKCDTLPQFTGGLSVGIKYGVDGANVAMSVAVKTTDDNIFVEAIDCKSVRMGTDWIVSWLTRAQQVDRVIVDGASGQKLLTDAMKDAKLKEPIIPKVGEIINANTIFEQAIYLKTLQHNGQPSLALVASNCDKRNIGSNGGFGYKALKPDVDISLLDSVILAHWGCATFKSTKKKQRAFC